VKTLIVVVITLVISSFGWSIYTQRLMNQELQACRIETYQARVEVAKLVKERNTAWREVERLRRSR
jgi:predicted negative regulator of RcsB-dependent stress response